MSTYINTIAGTTDVALSRSIVNRSITTLTDDVTTAIRQDACRACAALESVNFPSVTSVDIAAFWCCTALTKAEFGSACSFANNAFYGCSALAAVILRSTDQVCTASGTPFASSAIANGTGYIYVPRALVDTYKAASGWSTYASQIRAIEDYPKVCDPYTWETVFQSIDDGDYASVYKVGDLVPLDLGTEGVVNMQIAAFDTDDLADGSGKAPITWISKELLNTSHRMNAPLAGSSGAYTEGTGAIGGWEKSEMRTYLTETVKPLIPENIRSAIKAVTKTQPSYTTDKSRITQTTQDDVWIPSYAECHGSSSAYYGLFTSINANRIKRKVGSTGASRWWLRSASDLGRVYSVGVDGNCYSNALSNYLCGVALSFCLGASTPVLTITNNATNTTVTVDPTNGDTITVAPGETASITSPGEYVNVYYDATATGLTYQGITCKLDDISHDVDEPFIGDQYSTNIVNQSSRGVEGNLVITGGWS